MTIGLGFFRMTLEVYYFVKPFLEDVRMKSGMKCGMKCVHTIALILVIIGALNWGLWGFFQFDLVAWLFQGNTTGLSRFIYAIIGLAGLWTLGCLGKCKCGCMGSCTCKKK